MLHKTRLYWQLATYHFIWTSLVSRPAPFLVVWRMRRT